MWHPELRIGFGYVPFDFNALDFRNIRGKNLQKVVKDCVIEMKTEAHLDLNDL